MKFKAIAILSIILLAVLTVGVVCAADNNGTDEIIAMENAQNNDGIDLNQSDSEQIIEDNATSDIKSDNEPKYVLGKYNEDEDLLTATDASPILGATVTAPTKLTATKTVQTKLTATKKKTTAHYVKVGKYKGKLTNKQYKKLKLAYKKNNKYQFVTIKSTNKKYHKITIQYYNGINGQNGKYYKRGFYATVWDTRYGMDGTKIFNKRVHI